jgi:hypothetical protein
MEIAKLPDDDNAVSQDLAHSDKLVSYCERFSLGMAARLRPDRIGLSK